MYKKLLVLAVVILALLFALPESAHAAEECKRDHTDQKNFAFIGSCTDMKCFDCDYIWKNVISMHDYQIIHGCTTKLCRRCNDMQHLDTPAHATVSLACGSVKCTQCDQIVSGINLHTRRCVAYTCQYCGLYFPKSSSGQHRYSASRIKCLMTYTCYDCGRSYQSRLHHVSKDVSTPCQRIIVCAHCDEIIEKDPAHHKYATKNSCNTYPVCTRCGEQSTILQVHSFRSVSNIGGISRCVFCGEIRISPADIKWGALAIVSICWIVIIVSIVLYIRHRRRSPYRHMPVNCIDVLDATSKQLISTHPDHATPVNLVKDNDQIPDD